MHEPSERASERANLQFMRSFACFNLRSLLKDLHLQVPAAFQPFFLRTVFERTQTKMEGSNSSSSTGQGRQGSVTSLTDLASAPSGGQPPAAAGASSSSGGGGGSANAGAAATATLTITEEATQDVPEEQILRLSLAPRPRVTWCV